MTDKQKLSALKDIQEKQQKSDYKFAQSCWDNDDQENYIPAGEHYKKGRRVSGSVWDV